jgi:hypothetical protein
VRVHELFLPDEFGCQMVEREPIIAFEHRLEQSWWLQVARSLTEPSLTHCKTVVTRSSTVRVTLTLYQASLELGLSLKLITKAPLEYLAEQMSRQFTALKKNPTAFSGTRGTVTCGSGQDDVVWGAKPGETAADCEEVHVISH